ncbi:MAG: glutamine synthetase [Miltoncostaeaceae bacterium]|jgi:glutamine synthetase|nr:glutamine synthetase [Miltoncostaeaceae bacterium]
MEREGFLGATGLRAATAAGEIEEVAVAMVDMQGRLTGTRLEAGHFLEEALVEGFPACVYLLSADVEMTPIEAGAIGPSESGFGDFILRPDPDALRRMAWAPRTALALCDVHWPDGSPVAVSPRQVLRRQLERLDARGLRALAGTELEFLAFKESIERARRRGYRNLTPATPHNVDYALSGLGDLEGLARRIRRVAIGSGLRLESARGECHPGQYEIVFRYEDALTACDNHAIYKTLAREVAASEGASVTFMAKHDAGEGSSCHVHLSVRSREGTPVMADPGDPVGLSSLGRSFVAGQLAALPDLTLLMAPNVNSYKRLRPGAFAPSHVAWGPDDRTRAVRVVGRGTSLRIEHRVPGADANPYMAVAAMIAAGLHGIERGLDLPAPGEGKGARLPASLDEAADRFSASAIARTALGDEVVDHYTAAARAEADAFAAAVTDWERERGFGRL